MRWLEVSNCRPPAWGVRIMKRKLLALVDKFLAIEKDTLISAPLQEPTAPTHAETRLCLDPRSAAQADAVAQARRSVSGSS